jgi:hypothetical protein
MRRYIKAYTECINSKVPEAPARGYRPPSSIEQDWRLAAPERGGTVGLGILPPQARGAARRRCTRGCTF